MVDMIKKIDMNFKVNPIILIPKLQQDIQDYSFD